ncbi:MAG: GNAT family N-acetyltransferase [Coxiella sp. (in: Bacteria)]|nr:MAG: GNAT family N-acetyltransferase [Coxiella sp. (in: g-proteobacteria)]
MKILETKRLILRAWAGADIVPMAAINCDPNVMECFPELQDEARTRSFIEGHKRSQAECGYSLYVVALKATHEMIGFVGLMYQDFEAPFTPAVEIGWRLASTHWNKGCATEAAQAALDYAFDTLGLEEVVSMTAVQNTPSRRVMEKIGLHRNPSDDFDNAKLDDDSPLRRHVLYRKGCPI